MDDPKFNSVEVLIKFLCKNIVHCAYSHSATYELQCYIQCICIVLPEQGKYSTPFNKKSLHLSSEILSLKYIFKAVVNILLRSDLTHNIFFKKGSRYKNDRLVFIVRNKSIHSLNIFLGILHKI